MKKYNTISIRLLFTCLLLSFSVQCCAATTVSIEDITADPGGSATMSIMINDIEDYGAATIELEYDSAVVFVEDVTGSSDSTSIAKNIDNTAGRAGISAWNLNGVGGNIVFADVKIKAVGNSGDSTLLTLTVDTLQNISYYEIPATIGSGSLTISGGESDAHEKPVTSTAPSSMIPGFTALLLCTGLLTAYLITRLSSK